jgi:hypothetical protein
LLLYPRIEAFTFLSSSYALTNNIKQGMKALEKAIAINTEYRERAKLDPNFPQIYKDRRFQKLINPDQNKI